MFDDYELCLIPKNNESVYTSSMKLRDIEHGKLDIFRLRTTRAT